MSLSDMDANYPYLHVIAGYLGNSKQPIDTGYKDIIVSHLVKAHDSEIFMVDSDSKVEDPILIDDYMSPKYSWLYLVDYTKLTNSYRNKIIKIAKSTASDTKIWVFLLPYSDGKDGFPVYTKLCSNGFDGYWGTYINRDDARYLLRDKLHRVEVTSVVNWISNKYNRDPSILCKIYRDYNNFSNSILNLKNLNERRRWVASTYGVSTSSPLEFVTSLLRNTATFEQAYRLYTNNPQAFKGILLKELDTCAIQKSKILLHQEVKSKYKYSLEGIDMLTILKLSDMIDKIGLSDASELVLLTKRGRNAVLQ
jgi:hypothetical protein